jgi:hypothetical protein
MQAVMVKQAIAALGMGTATARATAMQAVMATMMVRVTCRAM